MLVQLSARQITFPRMCACCGGAPNTTYAATATRVTGKRVVRTQSASWSFPYCNHCLAHVRAWPGPWGCATWALAACTCFLWLIVQYFLDESAKARARQLCGAHCTQPDAAVSYLGWNGSVQSFEIGSRFYAYELLLANPRNAINVSYDVQAQLQQYAVHKAAQQAQAAVRYHAAALPAPSQQTVTPEEQFLATTLERLETLKGAASRRSTVEAALARIQDPRIRERLLVEAARIEVHAVLDKVDTLKTVAAKRRHLEAALEQLRNDPVPDELQTREIAALENALHALQRE